MSIRVSLDGGLNWKNVDEVRISYEDLTATENEQEVSCRLDIVSTNEGLITDVVNTSGAVLGTSSEMAQEIVERLVG